MQPKSNDWGEHKMLILTRRAGQKIMINGTEIVVEILGVNHGTQVRLGISAPANISVHREEIHDRIVDETQQAAEG